ncbi:ABC transporter permease [candidate division WOR-3 bacterium]|nr:ABC transporter permease [candidate division WOR-3 bacterium]TET80124.1 MAG: ABC transporter permease [Candidatus Cloacimonadota bacterium]
MIIRAVRSFFSYVGGVIIILTEGFKNFHRIPKSYRLILNQILSMGISSLPIVVLVSVFAGMVTCFQAAFQTKAYVPELYVGMSVAKAVMIELGPMLTGLVVAGRVSSSIAAELGTMKVTEQIDALEIMGIDPGRYLVMPRIFSGIITLPILTILAEIIMILGGLFVSVYGLDISPYIYLRGVRTNFIQIELWGGLIKSVVFGLIIGLMGCYHGFQSKGGAEGVGQATTRAVVSAMVLILIFDYFIARVVFA